MMGIWTVKTDSPGKKMCPADVYPSLQTSLPTFFQEYPSGVVQLVTP